MANIYDTANGLEREIRELPEFKSLEEAFAQLKANETAYAAFKDFQAFQQGLQEKQMRGEDFSDADAEQAQALAEKVQQEELINELMMKEQAFSVIINDLNRVIMTPIRELYEG
ncbi:YlbF family regulator [Enterococcus sp. 22-H-5-01]|uniref:YlbF family regulator n=1 Tax=Enterococcus TaxID=1350 RepID=UPI0038B2EBFA